MNESSTQMSASYLYLGINVKWCELILLLLGNSVIESNCYWVERLYILSVLILDILWLTIISRDSEISNILLYLN